MLCNLCPNMCNIDRDKQVGKCLADSEIRISKYDVFKFEEPCISGTNGSGNIFFSNCNLKCIYCQNYEINTKQNSGFKISEHELGKIMLELQQLKVHNINLVTPTLYANKINKVLKQLEGKLNIPVVYNCSGYENIETLEMLENIQIFLPDFKYSSNKLGEELSGVSKYLDKTTQAITHMIEKVGSPFFNEEGLLEKGVLIRHLVLPNNIENTVNVLNYIKKEYKDNVVVSLMFQYFPTNKVFEKRYEKFGLNRCLTFEEYDYVLKYFINLNFKYGYFQDLSANSDKYVPKWGENKDELYKV